MATDQAPVIVVGGPRGRGKSEWIRKYTAECPRVVYMDPVADYPDPERVAVFDVAPSLAHVHRWARNGRMRDARWQLSCRFDDTAQQDAIMASAYRWGPCVVVVEEAWRFRRGGVGDCTPGLARLLYQGRHEGITVICSAQRPSGLPRAASANASFCIVFATHEPADVKFWRDTLGHAEAADQVPRLTGHERIEFDMWAREWRVTDTRPQFRHREPQSVVGKPGKGH